MTVLATGIGLIANNETNSQQAVIAVHYTVPFSPDWVHSSTNSICS